MENDSVFSKKESKGKLKISLSAASGALPIAGAAVQIKKIDGDGTRTLLYLLKTDSSGKTQTVALAAPSAALSASPAQIGKSYTVYEVEIFKEEYYPMIAQNVAVFPGVTSLQPFTLQPVTVQDKLNGDGNRPIIIRDLEPNELEGS